MFDLQGTFCVAAMQQTLDTLCAEEAATHTNPGI
jgi:hypothetical protein